MSQWHKTLQPRVNLYVIAKIIIDKAISILSTSFTPPGDGTGELEMKLIYYVMIASAFNLKSEREKNQHTARA